MLLALASSGMSGGIEGEWMTENGESVISIAPCGRQMCGHISKIIKSKAGVPTRDTRNPNPALRERPIAGLRILTGLERDGRKWHGHIYDPRSGRTYSATLERTGASRLKLTGCVTFLCQSQLWQLKR